MAISTVHTYLMSFQDTVTASPTSQDIAKATKVMDITSFPDLGGTPEQIDVTTLSDEVARHINGVQKMDSLTFGANFEPDSYASLIANDGKVRYYGVFFGAKADGTTPDGHNGIITWKGASSTHISGGKNNEAIGIETVISCESKPTFTKPAAA